MNNAEVCKLKMKNVFITDDIKNNLKTNLSSGEHLI